MSVSMFDEFGGMAHPAIEKNDDEFFMLAVHRSHVGLVKRMASEGYDINSAWDAEGRSCLACAIKNGDSAMVKTLLDLGVSGAGAGLKYALANKKVDCVGVLHSFLEQGELMSSVGAVDVPRIKAQKPARVRL